MQFGEQLGPDRYLQVAYEDLVEKPLEVLDKVAVFFIITIIMTITIIIIIIIILYLTSSFNTLVLPCMNRLIS